MTVLPYQILIIAFAVLFILKTLSHYQRGEQTIRELVAIILFWGAVIFFTSFPHLYLEIASYLGFKDYVNAIFSIFFGILFYAVFKLILAHDRSERQLTEITRKLALKDAKNKKN